MRKRIVSLAAVMALLVVMSASAVAVEPRLTVSTPSLTFSGTTANCSVIVRASSGDEIDATLSLYRGSVLVDSWPGEGTTAVYISGSCSGLTKGVTYTLKVSGTVDGVSFSGTPVSATC